MAAGTGLVVARKAGGSWTPPSALGFYSCGWGFQFGGVVSDLLIVLRNQCAPLPSSPFHVYYSSGPYDLLYMKAPGSARQGRKDRPGSIYMRVSAI